MNWTGKAYAKINLFLDITGRRQDGYHTLNTVMQQIGLHDLVTVRVSQGTGICVSCGSPDIPRDERNIAYRAAEVFLRAAGKSAAVNIGIQKKIPAQAGLGGGSADGAAVLSALNQLFGEPLSRQELLEAGASLGADVPFCLCGGTAVCGGIGEKITPVSCRTDYVIGVVKPDFSCSTADAYRAYDSAPIPPKADFAEFTEKLALGAAHWYGGVYNVFERLYADERITALTRILRENGAAAAALTGSGSAVFGIFEDEPTARAALKKTRSPFQFLTRPVSGLEQTASEPRE